jgi:hypothetical protein
MHTSHVQCETREGLCIFMGVSTHISVEYTYKSESRPTMHEQEAIFLISPGEIKHQVPIYRFAVYQSVARNIFTVCDFNMFCTAACTEQPSIVCRHTDVFVGAGKGHRGIDTTG